MWDLLIRGGEVLDPGQGLRGRLDIAVTGGRIARIGRDLDPARARRVVEVPGRLVVPGLIDLHTHIYHGFTENGVHPDLAGVRAGVTTVVDAGSAGPRTFAGLARYVVPSSATRVLCLVHIGRIGLATMPEVRDAEDLDPEGAVAVQESHRGLVVGVKIRMAGPGIARLGLEAFRKALESARRGGGRLMVHIGDPMGRVDPDLTRQLLPLLEPGDILTHTFTGNPGRPLDAQGRAYPELREAKERGVTLDTAHGRFNFSFDTARRLLDQGILPDTISTDITVPGRASTVFSLTELMSKFLALGFTLEQVVEMTTRNPARALGLEDRLGALAEGREADITVLEVATGRFLFRDTPGETLVGETALAPYLTVRAGEVHTPDFGPHPWGWWPEEAS